VKVRLGEFPVVFYLVRLVYARTGGGVREMGQPGLAKDYCIALAPLLEDVTHRLENLEA
jgi:hypothetical protein